MTRNVRRRDAAALADRRSPAEDETLVTIAPLLMLWNTYAHARAVRTTMAQAYDLRSPVAGRVTASSPRRFGIALAPVYVHPQAAIDWLEQAQYPAPDGLRHWPGHAEFTAALEWMGRVHDAVRPAATQRIGGEPKTWQRPYRRVGWWVCSGLVWQRILDAHWVPVREPLPGRPAAAAGLLEQGRPLDTPTLRALGARDTVRHPRSRGRGGSTLDDRRKMTQLLADYAGTEPTCLLRVAHDQGRPLITRGPGRMNATFADVVAGTLSPESVAARLPLNRDTIVVESEALAHHIHRAQDRVAAAHGWSPTLTRFWTADTVALMLDELAAAHPRDIARVSRFATVDTAGRASFGRPAHGPGRFRVSLSWLGRPGADAVMLAAEWAAWQAEQEQQARTAELANVGEDLPDLSEVEETRV